MELTALYTFADKEKITVIPFDLPLCESLSEMMEDGSCFIGIDPFALCTEAEEKVKLAHEIGHCITGAFYNAYSNLSLRSKCERKADIWAIKKLIPKDELLKVIQSGYSEPWQLAEFFEVTEEFIIKAVEYYKQNMH